MLMCDNLGDLALGIRCPEGHLTYRKTRISQNPRKPEIRPNFANDPVISNKLWQKSDSKRNRRFWTDSFRTHLNAPFWPQACGIRSTWTGVDSHSWCLEWQVPSSISNWSCCGVSSWGSSSAVFQGCTHPYRASHRTPKCCHSRKIHVECLCMGQSISPSLLWPFSHTDSKTLCFQS